MDRSVRCTTLIDDAAAAAAVVALAMARDRLLHWEYLNRPDKV
jgi:hypothetical protein